MENNVRGIKMRYISIKRPTVYFLCFLLIPFFKPVGLSYYENINKIFQIYKLGAMLLIVFLVIMQAMIDYKIEMIRIKPNGFWGLYIFWFIYICNNVIHGTNVGDILNNALTSVFLLELVRYAIKNGWQIKLLNALEIIFRYYVIIQLLSVIAVRKGIILFQTIDNDYIYFLGSDNYSAFAVYPMLGIILFYEYLTGVEKKRKIKGLLLTILITFSYIYMKSMTAAFGGMIYIFLLIFYINKESITKLLSVKNIIWFLAILLILIQYGHIQYIFSNLLDNILHKSITLNSRTYIWTASIDLIKSKFVLGHGDFSNEQISNFILYGTTHAHNIFLELLLRTGIVGTIGYLWFILGSLKENIKYLYKRPVSILTATMVVQLVLASMDFYVTFQYFYCFMGIFYYAYCFIEKER